MKKLDSWERLSRDKDYDVSSLPLIKVSYADVLTRPLFYPENCFAYGMALLMRRKTFTKTELEHMRAMGFKVDISVRKIEVPEDCM